MILRYLSTLLLLCFITSCAQIVAPTGGTRDTTPPKVIAQKSTPNFQTQFKPKSISLTFDEWIKLDDAFNQVVISPPLSKKPKVELRGRTVVLTFATDEVLRDDATYTINFGNAVKDLNESNPAKDLRFVFSTGAVIDSLRVTAKVTDVLLDSPEEGITVMLYDNFADSAVRRSRPFYFGKTNKAGIAVIENVREGRFKVFALKDADANYFYNQETEKIGFPDSLLTVALNVNASKDTARRDSLRVDARIELKMFESEKTLRITDRDISRYGVARFALSRQPLPQDLRIDTEGGVKIATEIGRDSIFVFYDRDNEEPFNLYFHFSDKTDTVRVRPRGRAAFLKQGKLEAAAFPAQVPRHPVKPIILPFNAALQDIDNQLITLEDSSKKTYPLSIKRDTNSARKIVFSSNWQEGAKYRLLIQPNAITDIYGRKNDSIIALNFGVALKKEFADIALKVDSLDKNKAYIIEVLNSSNIAEAVFYVENKTNFQGKIETVQIEEHLIKITEDTNKNRRWDTGDYDKKRQPEPFFSKRITGLRPNWVHEEEINYVLEKMNKE